MTTSSALAASCRPTAVSSSRSNAKLERSCLLRRPAWDAPSTTPLEIAGFDLHIRVTHTFNISPFVRNNNNGEIREAG